MKDDWEARKSLLDFAEDIESELWWNQDAFCVSCALLGSELICAMACSDADSKRVYTCL